MQILWPARPLLDLQVIVSQEMRKHNFHLVHGKEPSWTRVLSKSKSRRVPSCPRHLIAVLASGAGAHLLEAETVEGRGRGEVGTVVRGVRRNGDHCVSGEFGANGEFNGSGGFADQCD